MPKAQGLKFQALNNTTASVDSFFLESVCIYHKQHTNKLSCLDFQPVTKS